MWEPVNVKLVCNTKWYSRRRRLLLRSLNCNTRHICMACISAARYGQQTQFVLVSAYYTTTNERHYLQSVLRRSNQNQEDEACCKLALEPHPHVLPTKPRSVRVLSVNSLQNTTLTLRGCQMLVFFPVTLRTKQLFAGYMTLTVQDMHAAATAYSSCPLNPKPDFQLDAHLADSHVDSHYRSACDFQG